MEKLSITDVEIAGKRVLIRVDFNVPLDARQVVTDDTRIRAALPTIRYALDKGAGSSCSRIWGGPRGKSSPP